MPSPQLSVGNCAIELMRGDITRIAVDAIVNAANSALAGGGGVDGAIHAAAGPSLMQELRHYDGCPTGGAVITGAGRLPAKHVIHAVGPVYRGGNYGEADLLASSYRTTLQLAREHQCQSISFPSISTGIYGYPMQDAAKIALSTITDWLQTNAEPLRVVKLVQFSDASYDVYRALLDDLSRRRAFAQTS